MALLHAFRPTPAAELRLVVSRYAALGEDAAERILQKLEAADLLIRQEGCVTDDRLRWFSEVKRAWTRMGWGEAAEYHLLTFDYPCFDYAREGREADRQRMREYSLEQVDMDRIKLDYLDCPGISLPPPSADLMPVAAREMWVSPRRRGTLTRRVLEVIVALTFGQTGSLPRRPPATPHLRRTSPSGGARHPSEGYVAVLAVPGFECGWYHVTMSPFSLRQLPVQGLTPAEARELFPMGFRRVPFRVGALIVITSLFERNMYRYREPRTFRTVHMDAGHLAATACLVAQGLGVRARATYADAAEAIEVRLGLDGLVEGYMATVALGGDGADEQGSKAANEH